MQVRLRDVADVMVVPIPDGIKREAASRRIDITCNVTPGRDLGSVAVEVDEKVRGLSHEQGDHPESLGELAARQASTRRRYGLGLLALLGIALVIYSDFASLRLTLGVAFTLPFALVGGGVHFTSPEESCRRSHSSASSRCWASPPATVSCW